MTRLAKREAVDLAKGLGLGVVETGFTGSGHIKLILRTPRGHTFMATFAHTPGDHRHLNNQKTFIRKKVRELDGIPNVRFNKAPH